MFAYVGDIRYVQFYDMTNASPVIERGIGNEKKIQTNW